jgi:hypothetical protein
MDLGPPVAFICDNFLPSAIDRLAIPPRDNEEVNIEQLAAADFVGCVLQSLQRAPDRVLKCISQQLDGVLTEWDLDGPVLERLLWCWNTLMNKFRTAKADTISQGLIRKVINVMGDPRWLEVNDVEVSPICAAFGCLGELFGDGNPELEYLEQTFPCENLMGLVTSDRAEIRQLALSLVDVITREHLEIAVALIAMDLIAVLMTDDDTFAIKAIVARIIRNLLLIGEAALCTTILASDVFLKVLLVVSSFDLGSIKLFLKAVIAGVGRLRSAGGFADIPEVLRQPLPEMSEVDEELEEILQMLHELVDDR